MSAVLSNIQLAAGVVGAASSLLSIPTHAQIGAISVQASITEDYEDTVEATEQPIEVGADITDHAYVKPSSLVLRCGWSNSGTQQLLSLAAGFFAGGQMSASDYVSGIYSQLLALQQSLQPITASTSLRKYTNLLIRSLRVTRDQRTSNALMVTATFRQIIVVSTQSTTLPPQANQANPANTAATQNTGTPALSVGSPSSGGSLSPSHWVTTVAGKVVSQ